MSLFEEVLCYVGTYLYDGHSLILLFSNLDFVPVKVGPEAQPSSLDEISLIEM